MLRNENKLTTRSTNNTYIAAATSQNTRRAYQSDIRHFQAWGGKLPTNTEQILTYLQTFAVRLNSRTLSRRLVALKNWHIYQGFQDPTAHPSVSKTLAGILRTHGKPKEKAPPILPEELMKIVSYLSQEKTLRASRDNALLQLAFFGAFRGSEIVAISYEHITWQDKGIEILIPHSKTDQTHEGQYCAIPYGNHDLCPIRALTQWLERSQITKGPIFYRLHRDNRLGEKPLTSLSVSNILRKRAHDAMLPQSEKFSSHSLRRGLATSASRDGASLPAIMRQGRWKNVNTVMEYIEAALRFDENAASSVLKKIHSE
ncbi:MAG: tyrosine-type recombinase/integrase [Proteobacteria bacterium]|nr:tyrosine-type recombinase/integrase [Pseudomonadota bacterium]